MQKTRSPLREPPLRNPGQSLEEEIHHLYDDAIPYFFSSLGFMVIALMAWQEHFTKKPLNPYAGTIIALGIAGYSIYRVIKLRKRIALLKMARDGEKVVGQELENLRRDGCSVFHDIKGDNFNLDHIIVSSHGIFVVETKTFSKPVKGEANVFYDGKKVLVNGHVPDRDPLKQVEANVNWLRGVLRESAGKIFPIRGVVVFPGWFVDSRSAKGSATWVLNPKALASFIPNEPMQIVDADVHLAAFHLSRYIRTPN
ncbi:MAG: NERD domain-containing protein [Anaerolineaceae bacterium]|nr:MAG: NERD domain-containing protein [Anaerolineaceae bacterium]